MGGDRSRLGLPPRQSRSRDLLQQNAFVATYLVKHLISRGVKANTTYPLTELLDEDAVSVIPICSKMPVQELLRLKCELWSSSEAINCVSNSFAAEAIYNALDAVFGGSFPFPINEAYQYIGNLESNTGFWLACISGYSVFYSHEHNPYAVFYWNTEGKSDDYGADLRRSTRRFNAFCSACAEMKEAYLDELSTALWAFFIASQSLAFRNMGLSPVQLGRLAGVTKTCVPNKMLEKALRFALKHSDLSAQPVQVRVFQQTIKSLLSASNLETGISWSCGQIWKTRALFFRTGLELRPGPPCAMKASRTSSRLKDCGVVRPATMGPEEKTGAALF
jgi:hypothetical protein